MRIDKLFTRPVVCVNSGQTLNDAAHLMWNNDCGCVPVVNESGELQGMLTDRDIAMSAYLNGHCLADIPVTKAMSQALVSCGPGDTVAEVERLMREHRVRRLPVVDAGKRVVGIVSLNDLATAGVKDVEPATVAQTLAAICAKRERPRSRAA